MFDLDGKSELLMNIWNYLTTDGMVENLTSEFIGIVFALIVVSFVGGWFVRRSQVKAFGKKWLSYRHNTADWIIENQKQLDDEFFYLVSEMRRIANKPLDQINTSDLETFRSKRISCISRAYRLQSFFERNHFSLRERDIQPASDFVLAVNEEFGQTLTDFFSNFEQFDAMLSTHLQGTNALSDNIGDVVSTPTRHDILIAAVVGAEKLINEMDRSRVLVLGNKLAAQLKR